MALVSEQLDVTSSLNDDETMSSPSSSFNEEQHSNSNLNSPNIRILNNVIIKPRADKNECLPMTHNTSETEQTASSFDTPVTWTITKFESSGSEYLPSDKDYESDDSEIVFNSKLKKLNVRKSIEEPCKTEEKCNKEIPLNTTLNVDAEKNYNLNKRQSVPSTSCDKNKERNLGRSFTSNIEIERKYSELLNPNQQYFKKPSAKERPTICPLCFNDVITHFPRHLLRHHKDNPEVQAIFKAKPKSKERSSMINALRKRGYFYLNMEKMF
ncbi:hypothetical protein ABEB36_000095 [Hypothenemus hampei]|uniref:Uncharacterized protein n=1 Tax=Hypothenemus hampei TaxID=57062 RepID=A0ABD1FDD8_HYPHA